MHLGFFLSPQSDSNLQQSLEPLDQVMRDGEASKELGKEGKAGVRGWV